VHCINTSVPTSAGSEILIVPSALNLLEYAAILLSIFLARSDSFRYSSRPRIGGSLHVYLKEIAD